MYSQIRTAFTFILLSLLLFACAAPQPTIQLGPGAEVIDGNLHRVDKSSVSKAYVDPAFNINNYQKILIAPLHISKTRVVTPDYTISGTPWQLNEEDREFLVQRYRTSMIKNFFGLGGYVAATEPGEGVLRIRVAISRVGPSMIEMPAAGSITNRHRTKYYTGGGQVRITGIIDDTGTGKPVARFMDIRQSKTNWAASNTLKSRENAAFLMESWARLFVYRLQENRKSPTGSGKSW